MKRAIPWDWFLAILLVIGLDVFVRSLDAARRLPGDRTWQTLDRIRGYERIAAENPNAEIVLTGSSTMHRILPDIVAKAWGSGRRPSVVDASFPGATTAAIDYAVEHLLLRDFRPRVLVYGLDTQSVNEGGMRRKGQGPLMEQLQLLAEDPARWRILTFCREHSALYRKQFVLRDWLIRPWTFRLVPPRPERQEEPASWTIATAPNIREAEKDHRFGPSATQEIVHVAERAAAQGVRLVLVNMPTSAEYVSFWPDGRATYDRYLAVLTNIAERLKVPLIDLNDGSFRHEEFSDPIHLYGEGSARASSMLGARLIDLGIP